MKHVVLLTLALALAACATTRAPDHLYQQLGAMDGITRIVDAFLFEIADDQTIIHHFAETDLDRFREKLIEQFCEVSGGPCEYTGDSMAESHRDMGITEAQFNSLVEDLIRAMESENVPTAAQNGLLAKLAPMHGEIMESGRAR